MSRRKRKIILSPDAEDDFAGILRYTRQTWGFRQMNIYVAKLNAGLATIAAQPGIGVSRDDLFPGCRCHKIEEHLVLYDADEREVRIARLLHKRMNLKLYL